MTMYRVTMTLTQKELLEFIDSGGAKNYAIQPVKDPDETSPDGFDSPVQSAARRHVVVQRRKRTSKVNEAILDRLDRGEAEAADLRTALEQAGLSPGSLSTGLALLQKDGKIRRTADGSYSRVIAA